MIFDKRASDALRHLENKISDYKSYCEAWEKEYEKRHNALALAARGLVNLPREYTRDPSLTNDQLTEIVREEWFIARVFDIYLWEIGAKNGTRDGSSTSPPQDILSTTQT